MSHAGQYQCHAGQYKLGVLGLMIILHPKKVSAHIGTDPSKTKFCPKGNFGATLVVFEGPKTNFLKMALKHVRSVPTEFCELFGV